MREVSAALVVTPTVSQVGDVWRQTRATWWIWLPLVSASFVTWVAFLYAGSHARRRSWRLAGVGYLALVVVEIVLLSLGSNGVATAGGLVILFTWVGGFAHALAIRATYLRRIADPEQTLLEAAEARVRVRENALKLVRDDPRRAKALGVGRPDLELSFDGGVVDLNSAPAQVVATLPNFTIELAHRLIGVREAVGGFASLDDFGLVMKLPAPLLDDLADRVVFLPH